jgi:hypothetical protein
MDAGDKYRGMVVNNNRGRFDICSIEPGWGGNDIRCQNLEWQLPAEVRSE